MSYEDQTNDDLRTELERRGLSTSGNKDDLVARLEVDDAENTAASPRSSDGPEADQNPKPAQPVEGGETVQGRPVGGRTTAEVTTGVPVQKREENQDAAIKGVVTNERGDVIG